MSFSIPTLRPNKSLSTSSIDYYQFCLKAGTGSADWFLINGTTPTLTSYTAPIEVTFLYAPVQEFLENHPNATEAKYRWTRGGPSCPSASGTGPLTSNVVQTITNTCGDTQSVYLYIDIYNASGWVQDLCCTPYNLLCGSTSVEYVSTSYALDLDPV